MIVEIVAIVSILMHVSNADNELDNEEIEKIFETVHTFYPKAHAEKLKLNEIVARVMQQPLALHEALSIVKNSATPLQAALLIQTALLTASDGDIHFFEEALLRVISQELFGTEQDEATDDLIAKMKFRLEFPEKWSTELWQNKKPNIPDEDE